MATAPPQYISHQTGKPNKNRSYYFICPISDEYKLGVKHGQEMYKGYQDWKKHIRNAVAQAIMTKGLSGEDAKVKEEVALNLLEEARKEEKNKEIINPEYEEWLKSKPTKTTKSKSSVSDLAIENENLKKELEDLKDKHQALKDAEPDDEYELGQKNKELNIENENLKKELEALRKEQLDREIKFRETLEELNSQTESNEEVNDLKSHIKHKDETINGLKAVIEELKKSQKQPRKKKEQTEV